MKKIKNLTQELSQKLNSLKRENLHHPMEKSYIRKELAKVLPIREGLILKFLSEVGILENTSTRTVDWTGLMKILFMYDLFDLPRMVNEGSFPSLGTKGVVIIFFK